MRGRRSYSKRSADHRIEARGSTFSFIAAELKSSEASKKWRDGLASWSMQLGRDVFLEAAARWLALGRVPTVPGVQISSGRGRIPERLSLVSRRRNSDERLPGLLANFAEGALKKIPMLGAVSQKVGNACVNVLAELPGLEPVSQLSRLAQRVKYDTAQRLIEEALTARPPRRLASAANSSKR